MQKLLVVFQATQPHTESLALALGLGAVQRNANIRLRLLATSCPATLEHQGYGRLKEDDLRWAEAIAVGVESPVPVQEFEELLQIVENLPEQSTLSSKFFYIFGPSTRDGAPSEAVLALTSRLGQAGLQPAPEDFPTQNLTPEQATQIGNRLAEI